MNLEFDDKGKYFTEVIPKDAVMCQIQTMTHTIEGFVYVRKDERLSDELNKANYFLPVTNAEIHSKEGEILCSCNFMVINREHIIWLMPMENPKTEKE